MTRIAIVGSALAGGAVQIIDAVRGNEEFVIAAIFDSNAHLSGKSIEDIPILGSSDSVVECYEKEMFDAAVIGIGGDLNERERLYQVLKSRNIPLANIIDSSVQMRMGVTIGSGNVILGNAYFGPNVRIGDNCYILNNVSIQHDSIIGNHSYLATGVIIGAHVTVGNKVRFEIGSGAKSKIKIEDEAVVPAGIFL